MLFTQQSNNPRHPPTLPTRRTADLLARRGQAAPRRLIRLTGWSSSPADVPHDDAHQRGDVPPVTDSTVSPSQCSMMRLAMRSEEHTSELQSHVKLVCRLLLEKKNIN